MLKKEVESTWPPTKPWPVRTEEYRPGLEYRFYLGEIPYVDPNWGLWAGEIMYDLRCALDHLAYELHIRRYGLVNVGDFEGTTMFPIFDTETQFRRRGLRRIQKLAQRDQRIILYLQPYERRNDNWQRTRDALGLLNTLHNVDKHRKLHVVTAAHNAAVMMDFPESCGFRSHIPWGAKKSHDHVETWTFRCPPPEMKYHRGAFLQVAIEHERQHALLLPLLESSANHVAMVLARFSDRFPPAFPSDGPNISLFHPRIGGWPKSYR